MTIQADKTIAYISEFVQTLMPNAEIQVVPEYRFIIRVNGERKEASFGSDEVDDFEIALEQYRNTNYFHTLENRIKFRIYILLGKAGLLKDFDISSEILTEKGEWLKTYRVDIAFDKWFSQILHEGLKYLSNTLDSILANKKLKLDDVREDKEHVDTLIQYYEEHMHLTSKGASMQSLAFLKAAAVAVILEREKKKKESRIPRVQKGLDQEIYSIVEKIREEQFRDIKLPECIYEYAIQQTDTTEEKIIAKKIKDTISDNVTNRKLGMLLEQLDPMLNKRREGAWLAFKSNNPDRLSQAANSMVELLDQVIGKSCKDLELAQYLTNKYQTHEETKWVDATRKWISETKSNLQRVKHHTSYSHERLTETLLTSAESVMLVILE